MTDQTSPMPTANDHARTVAHRLNALADYHESRGTGLPPEELRALAVSLGPVAYATPDPEMVAAWLAGQKPGEERLTSVYVVRRDDLLALLDETKDGAQS